MNIWGEIGHFALVLSTGVSLIVVLCALFAVQQQKIVQLIIQASKLQFYLLTLSMIGLAISFYKDDFSYQYIAEHSNSLLPWFYKLSAIWGGHEGSLLLWIWILNLWMFALVKFSKNLPYDFRGRVLGVLSYISLGFQLFIILTSNPFKRLPFAPFDGMDLNPLLQDPGLIFHPPLLYSGYVGFAVAFSFIVAALWQGRLDRLWLLRARPWTILAWINLTLGIALGSYWAYYELGWGGWWFWDPVENASLMPWLLGVALMHSLIASEKRALFTLWTAFLAISTFSLCLIGTFLVRSGVLTSVHAFANDSVRGVFILFLLIAISFPALLLLIIRAHKIIQQSDYAIISKETGLLINNWLLTGACFVVFIGTLYPLLIDILKLGKISVGAPYFNRFIVPLALIMLLFLSFSPLLQWKKDKLNRLKFYFIYLIIFSSITSIIIAKILFPWFSYLAFISVFLVASALFAIIYDYGVRIYHIGNKALKPRGAIAGMLISHFGLVLMIFAITMTSIYSDERDIAISEGDKISIANYQIELTGFKNYQGINYESTQGRFLLTLIDDQDFAYVLMPAKRQYFSSTMPMSESARYVRLSHDLYLAMGEEIGEGSWAVRVQYKPFISWIWIGALLMALGGICAAFDRAYFAKRGHYE